MAEELAMALIGGRDRAGLTLGQFPRHIDAAVEGVWYGKEEVFGRDKVLVIASCAVNQETPPKVVVVTNHEKKTPALILDGFAVDVNMWSVVMQGCKYEGGRIVLCSGTAARINDEEAKGDQSY